MASSITAGPRARWWALVVVCLAMFMNALDSSIVNVALPALSVAVPSVAGPSFSVTLPVGVPAPGALARTLTVNVTD